MANKNKLSVHIESGECCIVIPTPWARHIIQTYKQLVIDAETKEDADAFQETSMSEQVELLLYEHISEQETVVNKFKASTWDKFVLVKLEGMSDRDSLYEFLGSTAKQIQQEDPDRIYIFMSEGSNVSFYGLKEKQDES